MSCASKPLSANDVKYRNFFTWTSEDACGETRAKCRRLPRVPDSGKRKAVSRDCTLLNNTLIYSVFPLPVWSERHVFFKGSSHLRQLPERRPLLGGSSNAQRKAQSSNRLCDSVLRQVRCSAPSWRDKKRRLCYDTLKTHARREPFPRALCRLSYLPLSHVLRTSDNIRRTGEAPVAFLAALGLS